MRQSRADDDNDPARGCFHLGAARASVVLTIVAAAACSVTPGNSTGDATESGGQPNAGGARASDSAGVNSDTTAGEVAAGHAGVTSGVGGADGVPTDTSECRGSGSVSQPPCPGTESYIGGKCVPCTATGDACVNSDSCSDCCTRLGLDGVCSDCTLTGSDCVAADCHDCCSGFDAAGVCIEACTPVGSDCSRGDCSACCTGFEHLPRALRPDGVGVGGVCVGCLENADCACPSVCTAHECTCTQDGSPCAYDTCSDCCSKQSGGGRCTAGTVECETDDDCGVDQYCEGGQCEDVPLAMCTEPGEPCDAPDCEDCCSGTGTDGVCDEAQ